MSIKIRLFLEHPMAIGQTLPLERAQAHYLFGVMRQSEGDELAVFNGEDGEWRARISAASKRGGELTCVEQLRPQSLPPDLWLLFAPIKKARTDFIVEKAAEMGVRRIIPVQTDYTNSGRIQRDRLQAHAVEAAEQCGGIFVPKVAELTPLTKAMNALETRRLMFCDEALAGQGGSLPKDAHPWAVLIGPEGGFSQKEREILASHPNTHSIALGPRILRADTATVAALTLWQWQLGDWA